MVDLPIALEQDQDVLLVQRFKEGDETAFNTLFYQHKDSVYSLVYRTVGSGDADDVVQEVFIQIYKQLHRFRGESSFRTWVFSITLNVCRECMRKRGRRRAVSSEEASVLLRDIPDPIDQMSTRLTQSELGSAIESLPQAERVAIELRYIQGLTNREVADVVGCPEGTIKGRVHSAVMKLRRKLSHLVGEVDWQ